MRPAATVCSRTAPAGRLQHLPRACPVLRPGGFIWPPRPRELAPPRPRSERSRLTQTARRLRHCSTAPSPWRLLASRACTTSQSSMSPTSTPVLAGTRALRALGHGRRRCTVQIRAACRTMRRHENRFGSGSYCRCGGSGPGTDLPRCGQRRRRRQGPGRCVVIRSLGGQRIEALRARGRREVRARRTCHRRYRTEDRH
jgi:hypothetical protein